MYTPQESAKIQLYRAKVDAGTIAKEELQEAMALLRRGREGAHAVSATSRTRTAAAKKPVDSNALLDELGGL